MKITEDHGDARFVINAHSPGRVIVNHEVQTHSFIISPGMLIRDWPPQRFDDLKEEDFKPILTCKPEIVLLGTGQTLRFPHPRLFALLTDAGIGFEVMDTPAACRTYTILMAEHRRIVAALLLED